MPKRVTISMADPFIDAFSVLKSNFNRAADPDKQEKMSPYRRRNLGLMQDGRKEHINTRRIMGNLNDPRLNLRSNLPNLLTMLILVTVGNEAVRRKPMLF